MIGNNVGTLRGLVEISEKNGWINFLVALFFVISFAMLSTVGYGIKWISSETVIAKKIDWFFEKTERDDAKTGLLIVVITSLLVVAIFLGLISMGWQAYVLSLVDAEFFTQLM